MQKKLKHVFLLNILSIITYVTPGCFNFELINAYQLKNLTGILKKDPNCGLLQKSL